MTRDSTSDPADDALLSFQICRQSHNSKQVFQQALVLLAHRDRHCSELDREANIAKNRALFEDLGLKDAVASLGASKPKTAAKPLQTKKVKRERPEVEIQPRRQSRRLLSKNHVDPNETPEERKIREVRTVSLFSSFSEASTLGAAAEGAAKTGRGEVGGGGKSQAS